MNTSPATDLDPLGLDKGYERIAGRRYVHIAAVLSNGQRTARWSYDTRDDVWYVTAGWKIVNRRAPLNAEQRAYVERVTADAVDYDEARARRMDPPKRARCCGIITEHGGLTSARPCPDCPRSTT